MNVSNTAFWSNCLGTHPIVRSCKAITQAWSPSSTYNPHDPHLVKVKCPLGAFPWSLPWGDYPKVRLGQVRSASRRAGQQTRLNNQAPRYLGFGPRVRVLSMSEKSKPVGDIMGVSPFLCVSICLVTLLCRCAPPTLVKSKDNHKKEDNIKSTSVATPLSVNTLTNTF